MREQITCRVETKSIRYENFISLKVMAILFLNAYFIFSIQHIFNCSVLFLKIYYCELTKLFRSNYITKDYKTFHLSVVSHLKITSKYKLYGNE